MKLSDREMCPTLLSSSNHLNSYQNHSSLPSAKVLSENRVNKPSKSKSSLSNSTNSNSSSAMIDPVTQLEMHQLLSKLKELVPGIPRNKKLSKLEIIQNVIDYILDLEVALGSHPTRVHISTPFSLRQCNSLTHSHHAS
jgi:DNA-binding protein inhibitor ID-2